MAPTTKTRFLKWLRSAHLYVGLWGAIFGVAFGLTGILLNHRSVLKLPIERGERATIQVGVPASVASPEALAAVLAAQLGFELDHRSGPPRIKVEPETSVGWQGTAIPQPARWQINFAHPVRQAQAEYFVGNRFAKVERFDANVLGTLARLHMSIGVDAAWVLLMDSIAGSFVFMSASGLLLWSQMRRRRLLGLALLLAPAAIALIALVRLL